MATQKVPIEVNNFVGGLFTDSHPMTFPPDASLSESNMVMNNDGTRSRRLGMDVYEGFNTFTTPAMDDIQNISYKSYKWSGVAGIADLHFIVILIGKYLAVFNSSNEDLSADEPLFELDLGVISRGVDFTSVDGMLVVVTGSKDILYLEYDVNTNTITSGNYRLFIRDLFGVEDIIDGVDYRVGSNVSKRPRKMTDAHAYNLRNQTFAYPRLPPWIPPTTQDPIVMFRETSTQRYPSNADSVLDALYPNTAHTVDPTVNRFNPIEIMANPPGALPAPKGFFIIDALDRGTSRLAEINKLYEEKTNLAESLKTRVLPWDESPDGATCVAQFAGRVFYSGFTSKVIKGDSYSPRLGSFVLFSKLVENNEDLKVCHQVGDPTSKENYEVLDTDGGFIKLEGAYNIQGMVPLSQGLAVIAENGVWIITGEDRGQFKATSFSTSNIATEGCESPGSIVHTGSGFMFWSKDGIYEVSPDKFGDLQVSNLTKGKISKFYDAIPLNDRKFAVGILDHFDRCVKWVYGNRLSPDTTCHELVYNLDFKAFIPYTIQRGSISSMESPTPTVVVCPVKVPSFFLEGSPEDVYIGANAVEADGEQVFIQQYSTTASLRETKYLTVVDYTEGVITYTFSQYIQPNHYDWFVLQGDEGLDAYGYLLTGWVSGGDTQRSKSVPFLTTHFYKTEDGFTQEDEDGDFVINNKSSCKMQAQWGWSNHPNSGKWGSKFQAYRFSRFWAPVDSSDGFNDGNYIVTTRNKLRGCGKVLSLLLESEPGYHMNVVGWSMIAEVESGV